MNTTPIRGADRLRAYRQRQKAAGLPDSSKKNRKVEKAAARARRKAKAREAAAQAVDLEPGGDD